MADIPNYIGIPFSLVASAIISIAIIRYQSDILAWLTRRSENHLLKRKEKALRELAEIRALKKSIITFSCVVIGWLSLTAELGIARIIGALFAIESKIVMAL